MVLQRPAACEEHAGASAWSAAGGPPARPRPESQVALPAGPLAAPIDTDRASEADLLPAPDLMVLFSRTEYRQLAALRAHVRQELQAGRRPDDLRSDEG
jgi:hypothetical protein